MVDVVLVEVIDIDDVAVVIRLAAVKIMPTQHSMGLKGNKVKIRKCLGWRCMGYATPGVYSEL